ncbi:MAG: 9-O-acetylesterase [Verrucomicrobia bacterium]|nr:9-O-acetylesterase [Verrucomicrobiota bacterium]
MLAALLLAPLFSDHMVLQRGQSNPLWGKDQPNQVITLSVEGVKPAPPLVRVTVGTDGTWSLACPELPAGGPYRLHLQGSSEQIVDDVLVGEVWLASGQSNMEFKLPMAERGAEAVAAANDPQVRMFTAAQSTSPQPLTTATGSWQTASPKNAADFSAVGYFFAKELRQKLGVPVGIINASWGGTRVEAWTSREALRPVMDVESELAALAEASKDLPRIRTEYASAQDAWERKNFPIDTANEGEPRGWAKSDFNDRTWPAMSLPNFWQSIGMKFNGCVWFRRTLDIPAAWAGHDVILNLGAVDDFDTAYFNGQTVGVTPRGTLYAYQLPRRYVVPAELVKPGKSIIAVRVFDQFGEGGFSGPASSMIAESSAGGATISLAGEWRYSVEREVPLVPGSVYATAPAIPPLLAPQNNPAYLFNAMIAPFVGYGIRGAIWYQGEANVDVAQTYRARFTAMIRDWRTRWGQGDFPFYFVQLANFNATPGWPYLREAQTQTLAEPATGMAVILDIGNPTDIHPRNKHDVGLRLALLARAKTYGENNLEFSGPTLARVEIVNSSARVHWEHATGLRTRDGATAVKGFALAGADGVFHPADAEIDGASVIVSSVNVPAPEFVRYAWADNPETNLENAASLPAAPFRTDRL